MKGRRACSGPDGACQSCPGSAELRNGVPTTSNGSPSVQGRHRILKRLRNEMAKQIRKKRTPDSVIFIECWSGTCR